MKRVALISDIHGNAVALEAVLADIARRRVDEIACLGDVAAGGPQPREALEQLRALGCAVVRANADEWLLATMPAEDDRRLREIVEWARGQLTDADVAYLESFVPTVELDLGKSRRMLCFHGSPRANSERLLATTPEQELARFFAGAAADVLAGGHTHLQLARRLGGSLLVNPGSVGLPFMPMPMPARSRRARDACRVSPSTCEPEGRDRDGAASPPSWPTGRSASAGRESASPPLG